MSGLRYAQHVEPDSKAIQEKLQWAHVSKSKPLSGRRIPRIHSDWHSLACSCFVLLSGTEGEESTNCSLYNRTGTDLQPVHESEVSDLHKFLS